MPVNKNAQFRYQILDRCFSDFRHKYNFNDLLDRVNDYLADINGNASVIKARQLRDDINAIRKMLPDGIYLDAHPYYDRKCYYRYSERDFSIYQNELSVDDVQKLRSTIEMLGRYRGVPNHAWLEEVISNLEYRFGLKSDSDNVVSFEQNEQLVGLEYLSKLIEATVNHTPLTICYKTYRGIQTTTTLHPYHVKQYNNAPKALTNSSYTTMKQIGFTNFRKFQDFPTMDLGDITILVGGNNAGKSTVVKAMLLALDNLKMMEVRRDKEGNIRPIFRFDLPDTHNVHVGDFSRALCRNWKGRAEILFHINVYGTEYDPSMRPMPMN